MTSAALQLIGASVLVIGCLPYAAYRPDDTAAARRLRRAAQLLAVIGAAFSGASLPGQAGFAPALALGLVAFSLPLNNPVAEAIVAPAAALAALAGLWAGAGAPGSPAAVLYSLPVSAALVWAARLVAVRFANAQAKLLGEAPRIWAARGRWAKENGVSFDV